MNNTYGAQQSDAWLKNRVGRITASRIAEVCDYVAKGSKVRGDKRIESSAVRENYRRELISERMTGLTKNHFNSGAMQRGTGLEPFAIQCYEDTFRIMVQPVNFVLHPDYPFAGASPDGLIGLEGMMEVKCLLPWNHLAAVDSKEIEPERFAQVGWQLACGTKTRKWSDLVHFCPNIAGSCPKKVFDSRRIGRDELEWTIYEDTATERKLTGEAVIDYFTEQAVKFNAEIEAYMAESEAKPIAPFPVQILEDEPEPTEPDAQQAYDAAMAVIDQIQMTP